MSNVVVPAFLLSSTTAPSTTRTTLHLPDDSEFRSILPSELLDCVPLAVGLTFLSISTTVVLASVTYTTIAPSMSAGSRLPEYLCRTFPTHWLA